VKSSFTRTTSLFHFIENGFHGDSFTFLKKKNRIRQGGERFHLFLEQNFTNLFLQNLIQKDPKIQIHL